NENTSTTVTDISGVGNNGNFGGTGNTWVAGQYGPGVQMNGSGYLTIPDNNTLDLSVFTLSAWVRPTDLTGYRPVFSTATDEKITLYAASGECAGNAPAVQFVGVFGGYTLCGPSGLTLNVPAYLTGTHDGITLRLYVNAVQVASQAVADLATETSGAMWLGIHSFVAWFGRRLRG